MTDEQYASLMQAVFILNTGIQQLIDINMILLPVKQREVVDLVHNKYNKFLSDDTWVQDFEQDQGYLPDL